MLDITEAHLRQLEHPDLALICREPDTHNPEIFEPNFFYGHSQILKRAAGLKEDHPIRAVLEHGINYYTRDFVTRAELEAPLPAFLPNSRKRAAMYKTRSNGRWVMPVGSPFLYVQEEVDSLLSVPAQRQGTLCFPCHSTRYIHTDFAHETYAAKLEELPDKFKPVTVCIYWRDYDRGAHIPYQNRGFNIVSCGHMFDPYFLYRFYLYARRHQYACSNEIGSHLYYAVGSGCRYFHFSSGKIAYSAEKASKLVLGPMDSDETLQQTVQTLFGTVSETITPEQQRYVDDELGRNEKKTGPELRQILQSLQWRDRFFFLPPLPPEERAFRAVYYRLPAWFQRLKLVKKLFKKRHKPL